MEALRPLLNVEPVDPLTLVPQPGEMAELYQLMRTDHPDGMSLVRARHRYPYSDIVASYVHHKQTGNGSHVDFWNDHFESPPTDEEVVEAPPGMTIDEYTLAMRRQMIRPATEQGEANSFNLWLPYDRYVAGAGRFGDNTFYWDNHLAAKGLAADGEWDQVQNIADNMAYEAMKYGHPLNANVAWGASRAQPDLFAHVVRLMAEHYGDEALVHYLEPMERNHNYWMDGREELARLPRDGQAHALRRVVRLENPDGSFSFLNRYWDDADGPRLEMLLEDVNLGEEVAHGLEGPEREARLAKLYKDLRGAAESGMDFSSRWARDGLNLATVNTTDIIPIENGLLKLSEETLARAYEAKAAGMSRQEDKDKYMLKAHEYRQMAQERQGAMDRYLWDSRDSSEGGQVYRDYNFVDGHQTSVLSAATVVPLYVGMANPDQAFGVARAVERQLLTKAGVATTTTWDSKEQWDGKAVWAMNNWKSARGFAREAYLLAEAGVDASYLMEMSEQVRTAYVEGVEACFDANGLVPEKIYGPDPTMLIKQLGEYANVKVLAMTVEGYRAMRAWDPRNPTGCLPMDPLARAA